MWTGLFIKPGFVWQCPSISYCILLFIYVEGRIETQWLRNYQVSMFF